ncbi:MAG: lysophospholipid acyltransferase family protein [Armatimonadota bacterium]
MRSWTWPHYYACRTVAYCIFRLAGGYEVRGKENVPEGGALLAANHISYADPPAVGTAFRERCYYFAKRQLFEIPLFGPFIRSLYAFPVNREGVDRKAIRSAAQLLKAGEKVIIFPEGTRSPDGTLQEGTEGAAFIAKLGNAPMVPTAVVGTDDVLPRGSIFLHRGKTIVSFGEPVYVTDYRDEQGDIDLRAATDELMKRIGQMIDEIHAERQAAQPDHQAASPS